MKISELQKYLQGKIDIALFFNNDANITYFSGTKPENACLAIPANGKPALFVPGFEAERMKETSTIEVVKLDKDFLKNICSRFPARKIGIIPGAISYQTAEAVKTMWNAELVSVEQKCKELRMAKTKEEIARTTKACTITDEILQDLFDNIGKCRTEIDAATFLKTKMSQYGLEQSFPPIVATAGNAAIPHHIPENAKLKGFTVIDFGIIYKNYCSDITRTIFVGSLTDKQREIYEKVRKVQEASVKKCSIGNTLDKIDEEGHKALGEKFIHRIGHSLGIEVHDVQTRPLKLKEGMIVTIEPGLYEKGKYGIRIEDDVLITKDKPVVLTKTTKKLKAFLRKL
ncbi:MAG TPA: Xaa-Pro peptidase family protein [Candidatus Nanoarchaeia archaeon]|nr:Xaa-Pro peptidase family protein [Candidatus Nanoarchaeia archaeon]